MPLEYPAGCRYCTRCPKVATRCSQEMPNLKQQAPGHYVACWLY